MKITFDSAPGLAEDDLIAVAGQKRPCRVVRVCETYLEVKRLSRLRWWWMQFWHWAHRRYRRAYWRVTGRWKWGIVLFMNEGFAPKNTESDVSDEQQIAFLKQIFDYDQ